MENNKPIILLDEYEKEIDIEIDREEENQEIEIEEPEDIIDCPGDIETDFEICSKCGKELYGDESCDCEEIEEPEFEPEIEE